MLPRPGPRSLLGLFLILACALPLDAGAATTRVATILVQGLRHVGRDRLLADLLVAEGDPYTPDLDAKLIYRAKRLTYLRRFRVESRVSGEAAHLTLAVREASRLRLRPVFVVQEDGDLGGGFQLESDALLGGTDRWEGSLIGGGRTEAVVSFRDLRWWPSWLPGLNAELGVMDWDHPFWGSEVRNWWALAGPSTRLPGKGNLLLLGGIERMDSDPPAGTDPDGEDEYGLMRGHWRQPILGEALSLYADAQLRGRQEERGFARGELGLRAGRRQGRWVLSGLVSGGAASERSPIHGIYHLSSWHYLRAYEPGTLPARRFLFGRLRADIDLFGFETKLRRRGPGEDLRAGLYLLVDGARLAERADDEMRSVWDYGLGASLAIPARFRARASIGIQWNRDGASRRILLLEAP